MSAQADPSPVEFDDIKYNATDTITGRAETGNLLPITTPTNNIY